MLATPLLARSLGLALAGTLLAGPALADCAQVTATGFNEYRSGKAAPRTNYKANEKFVVCVTLEKDAYVSLWDVPPHGAVERLYPNAVTHPGKNVAAEMLKAGKQHCFGTPENFPLYFPQDEGKGRGKVSVIVTQTVEDQVGPDDFAMPGKVARSRFDSKTRNYGLGGSCQPRINRTVEYNVE
jgi:hypothetical protein